MNNITQNAPATEPATDTAAEEASITAQSERSVLSYGREATISALSQREHIYRLIYQAGASLVEAVTAMIDDNEATTKAWMSDAQEYKRSWWLAQTKLDASNRTVRWLRAQLTAKTNESSQVAGGAL
jgi:poly(3-hydroxyalkanoate) synthetase